MRSFVLVGLWPKPAKRWCKLSHQARRPANSTPWAEKYSVATEPGPLLE